MKTNPVLDAIRNRRSVRTYDPRPLPADVLATIVEAGTLAPTGMNAQTVHFTVIQDAEKLHELNRLIRTALIRYEGRQLNEDYCCYYDAPVLVIASNEPTRTGGMDCACALQNMFLAAHSLGIASCWINQLSYTCDAPEVRAYLKRLGVPTVHKVYGCAALGYNGGKEPAAHPRKEGLVSYAE